MKQKLLLRPTMDELIQWALASVCAVLAQAVSNELNGERVDIVLWDDNPAQP